MCDVHEGSHKDRNVRMCGLAESVWSACKLGMYVWMDGMQRMIVPAVHWFGRIRFSQFCGHMFHDGTS